MFLQLLRLFGTPNDERKSCGRKSTILKRFKKFQVDSSKKMALGTNGLIYNMIRIVIYMHENQKNESINENGKIFENQPYFQLLFLKTIFFINYLCIRIKSVL